MSNGCVENCHNKCLQPPTATLTKVCAAIPKPRPMPARWPWIVDIIIQSWMGTLEPDRESTEPGLAEAMSCEDNQYLAAHAVFEVSTFTPPPDLSKRDAIDKAKWIASDGRLGRWD